jgi:transposase
MLSALLAGETDPQTLAELARGQLRKKRTQLAQALQGRLRPHQSFVLTELLTQIDTLDETITRFDLQIQAACAAAAEEAEVVALLDTIPGVATTTAQILVAEIGSAADVPARATPGCARSWCKPLRQLRIPNIPRSRPATGASRRGAKRAVIALAHTILVIAYHLIARREPYQEPGEEYRHRADPEQRRQRLVRQLGHLGFEVTLRPTTMLAPAGGS